MTTEIELNVRVFELMGAEWIEPSSSEPYWQYKDFIFSFFDGLPLIHENFQLTLDWLVPFMTEKGYQFTITSDSFSWFLNEADKDKGPRIGVVPIRHFKIAKAACLAAIPILEKIKEERG